MMGIRLSPRGERPLAAVEVNLVNLPTPVKTVEQPRPVEPVKRLDPKPSPTPVPVRVPVAPVHTPPATATPIAPAPAPTPTPISVPPRASVAKDILKDLELPPDAPKFGELTPAKAVSQPRAQAPAKSSVPDLPRIPDVMPDQAMKAPQRTSISEDLNRELEEELKKVKEFKPAAKLEIPKEAPIKPAPQQEAAIPQVKAPQTQLKTSGSSGTNPFWGRVEAIIRSNWEPPPVDITGTTYSAVIRFRFYRNGTVKEVAVQQSSGNSYFDDAGRRAILKPRQFPMFPSDMTETYQDVEMVFRVGESAG
jgi:TonB family protein